jgi:hypothetical protein
MFNFRKQNKYDNFISKQHFILFKNFMFDTYRTTDGYYVETSSNIKIKFSWRQLAYVM